MKRAAINVQCYVLATVKVTFQQNWDDLNAEMTRDL